MPAALSRAVLLCAACGPLSTAEVRTYCPELSGVSLPGLVCERHRCYLLPQPDWPELYRLYSSAPDVRATATDLMRKRSITRVALSPDELAAAARMALLEGAYMQFGQVLRRLSERPAYGWLRWAEQAPFWESVLGPALAGVGSLPHGLEVYALRQLAFHRYALRPMKCGELLSDNMPPWARAALRLRDEGTYRQPELSALQLMLQGRWEQAHREFLKIFPPAPLLYRDLYENSGAPLLVYAILNGIQAGARHREISSWIDAAEAVLLNYVIPPASDDVQAFFNNLRVMDVLVNKRSSTGGDYAELHGPLSLVPLILCRHLLSADMQRRLGQEAVQRCLSYLEHAELHLLKDYVVYAVQGQGEAWKNACDDGAVARAACLLQVERLGSVWRLSCMEEMPDGSLRPQSAEKVAPEWLELCPALADGQAELTELTELLRLLWRLEQADVPLRYLQEPIRIIGTESCSLQLTAHKRGGDWFEMGASLNIGSEQECTLSQLMKAYPFRCGDFLPIGRQCYIHLSAAIAEQLQLLSKSITEKEGRLLLPRPVVPALVQRWSGELPPAWQRMTEQLQREAELPDGLHAELRNYQLAGFRWLAARASLGLGACLADDMGLGKTLQTLALLLSCADKGPSLIVAPLSLLHNWELESARFAPGLTVQIYRPGDELPQSSSSCLVLASYGQLVAHCRDFAGLRWNVLVLDEAQAIKNPRSRRSSVLRALVARARVCLTGTPVENKAADLMSLMQFLNPSLPFAPLRREPPAVARERLRQWAAPLMLRRTREGVLAELPELSEKVHFIELSVRERALYERRCRAARALSGSHTQFLAELTRLRRLCCAAELVKSSFRGISAKLKYMSELAEELCRAGHRVLVFSQFTDVLDLAEQHLHRRGMETLRLDGSTPERERGDRVRQFQSGRGEIFLLSLKVGGAGLNLTAADYVLLLDPWWNPAVEAQAAARSHRMGQQRPVTVCRLIAAGTVEERMLALQEEKKELAETLVAEGALPVETLLELL